LTPAITTVVAAIIERGGRILICRRKPDQPHPFKWEFPGGKVEAGESPPQALRRELEEELALCAGIGAEVERYEFRYPGKPPILLIFHAVTEFSGEPRNRIFEELRWAEPKLLPEFDFLEGDVEFVKRLAAAH
jgi:8-oxo-dGTP diphosphatase